MKMAIVSDAKDTKVILIAIYTLIELGGASITRLVCLSVNLSVCPQKFFW